MEQLFGSKTRTKLLKMFMSNPNRPFYVREITRKIEEQINSVRRELANLSSLGVITSDSTDNKLYYEVDQTYEHYNALRELFTGEISTSQKTTKKTNGKKSASQKPTKKEVFSAPIVDEQLWNKAGKIAGLVYSGVFTHDNSSPVDVMIIGNVPTSRAEAAVTELEKDRGTELRYSVMELDEWKYRKQVNDKFWQQVVNAKNQIVIDTDNIFAKK